MYGESIQKMKFFIEEITFGFKVMYHIMIIFYFIIYIYIYIYLFIYLFITLIVPGNLSQVSVAADGTCWGVNADYEIFRWDGEKW